MSHTALRSIALHDLTVLIMVSGWLHVPDD